MGPLLFILYINDFTNVNDENVKLFYILTLHCFMPVMILVIRKDQLSKVGLWLQRKQLTLNVIKTHHSLTHSLTHLVSVVDARWGDIEDASLTGTCQLSLDSARRSRLAPLWVVHSFTLSNHDFFCPPLLRLP